MPGVAMDGSEDLPSYDSDVVSNPYGRCPVCNRPGITRAKNMVGTTYCRAGHRWDAHPIKTESRVDLKQNTPYTLSPEANETLKSLLTELQVVRRQLNHIEDSIKKWQP